MAFRTPDLQNNEIDDRKSYQQGKSNIINLTNRKLNWTSTVNGEPINEV